MFSQTIEICSITFKMDGRCSIDFSTTVTIHDNGVFHSFLLTLKKTEFLWQVHFFLMISMCKEFRFLFFLLQICWGSLGRPCGEATPWRRTEEPRQNPESRPRTPWSHPSWSFRHPGAEKCIRPKSPTYPIVSRWNGCCFKSLDLGLTCYVVTEIETNTMDHIGW